ncbi:hypothetical protein [Halobacillus sp. A5]|nr:hypothetical protein [Halobacillus sp. A5]MCP3026641.1 hypothetical protein [Halobacillus sp. A5]
MKDHLERLKEEVDQFSDEQLMITVSQKDLIKLMKECERHRKTAQGCNP